MGINKTRRFILSGVPGSGKSTVIEGLHQKGCPVFYEYSRQLIQESIDSGSDVLPWEDLNSFTKEVTIKRIEQYENAQLQVDNFYDRGILDSAAYFLQIGENIPTYLEDAIRFHPYNHPVFLFEPWEEIYNKDSQRKESIDSLEGLNECFKEVCNTYNYPYIDVPMTTVKNRVKFILEYVDCL